LVAQSHAHGKVIDADKEGDRSNDGSGISSLDLAKKETRGLFYWNDFTGQMPPLETSFAPLIKLVDHCGQIVPPRFSAAAADLQRRDCRILKLWHVLIRGRGKNTCTYNL
jgi:hypothetical protein